ncbi:MAG: response regulator, partial [Nitrospirae bacterium]|nr:response regulator [Nitrospirota bacterium]
GIIKQHNGYINVYSEKGIGTTFKIYLPLSKEEEEQYGGSEVMQKIEGGTETILFAEDSPDVRESTVHLLKEFGYRVIEAYDGEDAIEKFKLNKDEIQLVILDIVMPKKNGMEVYEEIKKEVPEVKVIFTSGYSEDVISKKLVAEKGYEIIQKPLSPSHLLKRIKDILNK